MPYGFLIALIITYPLLFATSEVALPNPFFGLHQGIFLLGGLAMGLIGGPFSARPTLRKQWLYSGLLFLPYAVLLVIAAFLLEVIIRVLATVITAPLTLAVLALSPTHQSPGTVIEDGLLVTTPEWLLAILCLPAAWIGLRIGLFMVKPRKPH